MIKWPPNYKNPKSLIAIGLIVVGGLIVLAFGGWIFKILFAALGIGLIWLGIKLLRGNSSSDHSE